MSLLMIFLPWIILSALSSYSLPTATFLALIVASIDLIKKRKILEWTTFFFFVAGFLLSLLDQSYTTTLSLSLASSLTLSLIAWISLAMGKPFTLVYAKERTPKDKWSSPLFFKINKKMTLFFGAIFSSQLVLKIVQLFYPNLLCYHLLSYLFLLLLLWLITCFPEWYKRRHIGTL